MELPWWPAFAKLCPTCSQRGSPVRQAYPVLASSWPESPGTQGQTQVEAVSRLPTLQAPTLPFCIPTGSLPMASLPSYAFQIFSEHKCCMSWKRETRLNPSLSLPLKKLQSDSEIIIEPCNERDAGSRVSGVLWKAQGAVESPGLWVHYGWGHQDRLTQAGGLSCRGVVSRWASGCENLSGAMYRAWLHRPH